MRLNYTELTNIERLSMQPILEMEANQEGEDYVIGDVHGNADGLRKVLGLLKKGDRLFITGDIMDKGGQVWEALALILDHPKQVFSVRGNHEDMCLVTLRYLESLREELQIFRENKKVYKKIANQIKEKISNTNHYRNGGQWLFEWFLKNSRKNNEQVNLQLTILKNFLQNLPYIISVKGRGSIMPFHVVHANMPFNDATLADRLKLKQTYLTPEEKRHAIWERHPQTGLKVNIHATLVYCGHSIVIEKSSPLPVRLSTNTINIDVGAYYKNVFLVINHMKRTAEYVGPNKAKIEKKVFFIQVKEQVNSHLALQEAIQTLIILENRSKKRSIFALPPQIEEQALIEKQPTNKI